MQKRLVQAVATQTEKPYQTLNYRSECSVEEALLFQLPETAKSTKLGIEHFQRILTRIELAIGSDVLKHVPGLTPRFLVLIPPVKAACGGLLLVPLLLTPLLLRGVLFLLVALSQLFLR